MQQIVIGEPNRRIWLFLMLGATLAALEVVLLIQTHGRISRLSFGLALWSFGSLGGAYLCSGTKMKLSSETVGIKAALAPWKWFSWVDVREINVVAVPYSNKGNRHFRNLVGVRLEPNCLRAKSRECARNRKICGFDVLIAASFGTSEVELVRILNAVRRNGFQADISNTIRKGRPDNGSGQIVAWDPPA